MWSRPIVKTDINLAAFVTSTLKVNVSSAKESKPTSMALNEILEKAKAENRAVIFTFTPGPFKDAKDLPPSWIKTEPALGCTLQLNTFEKNIEKLNARVYAVNNQSAEYQCGAEGLLAKKNWSQLQMISDENGELKKLLGLPTITVDGKEYIARLSFVIRPDGEMQVFALSSPVTEPKAEEHINEINKFIAARLEAKDAAEAKGEHKSEARRALA